MPSFLRRLSTLTGKSSPSSTSSPESAKSRRPSFMNKRSDKKEIAMAMAEELNRYSAAGHYSNASTSSSASSQSSHSAAPTLSSASSLSLPPSLSDFAPFSLFPSESSLRQSSEVAIGHQHCSNPAAPAAPSVADRRSKSSGDSGSNSLLLSPPGSLPISQPRAHANANANTNTNTNANANVGDSNTIQKNNHPPQSSSLESNQTCQPQRQHQHQQHHKKFDQAAHPRPHSSLPPASAGSSSTSSSGNNNSNNSSYTSKSGKHTSLPIPTFAMSPTSSSTSSDIQYQQQPQQGQLDVGKHRAMKRGSINSLAVLFHPKSRSLPMLQDLPTSHLPRDYQPSHPHHLTSVLPQQQPFPPSSTSLSPVIISAALPSSNNSKGKNSSSLKRTSLDSSVLMGASRNLGDKTSRRKSLSNMLLQSEQQFANLPLSSISSSSSQQQPKSGRWAGRGGIGAKNEMMVDLETSGVFVPKSGQRLRAEFVYRAVIQCADEIRRRGLGHPNIFLNPSPKKVISAMISLMADQERSSLYTTECLRIDTVASLMLNLLSQMSNPVVPYAIMEHYFQQGSAQAATKRTSMAPPPMPPLSNRSNSFSGTRSSPSPPLSTFDTLGASLPVIPALPVLNSGQPSPRTPSSSVIAWSREHFDLQMFLEALPAMNRVVLLEVLHLCAELLQHQLFNRLTLHRLVQQVAPALFSTVFDQRILEQVSGGSRRCSIHSDRISAEEGTRAENHLFTVILVRFLHITAASQNQTNEVVGGKVMSDWEQCTSPTSEWPPSASAVSVQPTTVYGTSSTQFRKSQELLQLDQQEHYQKMAQSFQEMEIQQDPRVQQHFGQYSASQKQRQQEQLQQRKQQSTKQHSFMPGSATTAATPNDHNVTNLDIKSSSAVSGPSRSPKPNPSQILLPQSNQDPIQTHRDIFWQSREVRMGAGIAH